MNHPSKEERVGIIEAMMRRDEWVRGETGAELAETWGMHPRVVAQDAAEASRNIRRALSDSDLRDDIIAKLDEIASMATDDKQFGPAVQALRTQLDARGILSRKLEVTVSQVERMTSEQKARAVLADPVLGPLLRRIVLEELPEAKVRLLK